MNMQKWLNVEFNSSSETTAEFTEFAKDFKKFIKGQLAPGQDIVNWSRGHFYVSGFIKQGDRFVYFSTSDVRHFPLHWWSQVLIRTAKNDKDYTGGPNCYCPLERFGSAVNCLMRGQVK